MNEGEVRPLEISPEEPSTSAVTHVTGHDVHKEYAALRAKRDQSARWEVDCRLQPKKHGKCTCSSSPYRFCTLGLQIAGQPIIRQHHAVKPDGCGQVGR